MNDPLFGPFEGSLESLLGKAKCGQVCVYERGPEFDIDKVYDDFVEKEVVPASDWPSRFDTFMKERGLMQTWHHEAHSDRFAAPKERWVDLVQWEGTPQGYERWAAADAEWTQCIEDWGVPF